MVSEDVENKQNTVSTKVLVADDDPPTRMLLRVAIKQWGYEVVEAQDGEEAWEALHQNNPPRLLILDWLMPKLDGIALCTRIKNELNFRPYIVLLTQIAGTANIIKGLEAGADEFLSKPFNMAELRSRLSVGARIIGYEIALRAQNEELQHYITQVASLAEAQAREIILQSFVNLIESATKPSNSKSLNVFTDRSDKKISIIFENTDASISKEKILLSPIEENIKKIRGKITVEDLNKGGVRYIVEFPLK